MVTTHEIKHQPTVAYFPWINGTVERLNRDTIAALRAVLRELRLARCDKITIIEALSSVLDEALERRLGKNRMVQNGLRCKSWPAYTHGAL